MITTILERRIFKAYKRINSKKHLKPGSQGIDDVRNFTHVSTNPNRYGHDVLGQLTPLKLPLQMENIFLTNKTKTQ